MSNQFKRKQVESLKTYSVSASELKIGSYVLLQERPCKIFNIVTSKLTRHGPARTRIVGKDIFTNQVYDDFKYPFHNFNVPYVSKKEYTLLDIQNDGFVVLMNDDGSTKEDLKLPETQSDFELVQEIKKQFQAGKDILISVLAAVGEEKIDGFREAQDN